MKDAHELYWIPTGLRTPERAGSPGDIFIPSGGGVDSKINTMAAAEQVVRRRLVAWMQSHPGEDPPGDITSEMTTLDRAHSTRVKEIIDAIGWPTNSKVGAQASSNAWLIIHPALQILLYTVIFSQVLAAKLPGIEDGLAFGRCRRTENTADYDVVDPIAVDVARRAHREARLIEFADAIQDEPVGAVERGEIQRGAEASRAAKDHIALARIFRPVSGPIR